MAPSNPPWRKATIGRPPMRVGSLEAPTMAMERGANGFLNKPFTDRQLNEAIAELMS